MSLALRTLSAGAAEVRAAIPMRLARIEVFILKYVAKTVLKEMGAFVEMGEGKPTDWT